MRAVDAGDADAEELVELGLGARLNQGLDAGLVEPVPSLDLALGRVPTSIGTFGLEEDGPRVVGRVDVAP